MLQSDPAVASVAKSAVSWSNPLAWLREKRLSRGYWILYTAFFFFHSGIAAYYFLFNLFLLDCHFDDRVIGLVGGALSLGTAVGAFPAGLLAKKAGLRPLLIACFVATPAIGALRTVVMWETAQIGLAFLAGVAMCLTGVCCLPAVARLSTEDNRAAAFGLIYSTSVGMSALGGVVCGYLPLWIRKVGFVMEPAQAKRLMLIAACGVAATGLFALIRLRMPSDQVENPGTERTQKDTVRRRWRLHPFLLRFIPAMILWTAVLTSFAPFSSVYLSQGRHIPLAQIGVIFFVAQIMQSCLGMLSPMVFRWLGLLNGIVATQVVTAVALGCLACTEDIRMVAPLFIAFTAIQWMNTPGLENLLMSGVPDEDRSTASSTMMFCNAVVAAGATGGAGILFGRFGYPRVMLGISALALVAAFLFGSLVSPVRRRTPVQL
jgi:predicted MFS family arabinose efflux permease